MTRAAPFYCPYCGDEDIRPYGEKPSAYRCSACLRAWELRFVGLGRPDNSTPSPHPSPSEETS